MSWPNARRLGISLSPYRYRGTHCWVAPLAVPKRNPRQFPHWLSPRQPYWGELFRLPSYLRSRETLHIPPPSNPVSITLGHSSGPPPHTRPCIIHRNIRYVHLRGRSVRLVPRYFFNYWAVSNLPRSENITDPIPFPPAGLPILASPILFWMWG